MRPPEIRRILPALLAAVLVTACSAAGQTPSAPASSASPSASGSPSGSPQPSGSGADTLLLRISADGGFVAPGVIVTRVPQLSVYIDGRAMEPGVITAIYPGPAVNPLIVHKLDEAGIGGIRAAARAAGLAGPNRSYTSAPVADVETTVFTYVDADGTHVLSIYALGFKPGPNASPEETAARLAAGNLVTAVQQILAASSSAIYQPTAYRIYATRQDAPSTEVPAPNALDWPADLPALASLDQLTGPVQARCGVIDGARLASSRRSLRRLPRSPAIGRPAPSGP